MHGADSARGRPYRSRREGRVARRGEPSGFLSGAQSSRRGAGVRGRVHEGEDRGAKEERGRRVTGREIFPFPGAFSHKLAGRPGAPSPRRRPSLVKSGRCRGGGLSSAALVVRAARGVRTIRKAARTRVVVLAAVAQEATPDGGSRRRSPPFRSQGSEEEGDDDREPPVAWGMKPDREAEHCRDTQGGNKSFEEASHVAPRSGLLERSPTRARSRRCTAGCPGSSRTLWASRRGRSERADSRRRSCD